MAAQESVATFDKGWVLAQVLGEGAFGEVRLLVHTDTGQEVAVKLIDLSKDKNESTKREITVMKMLKHENVIGFIGQRVDGHMQYIFLEYASGGELFDRIEPDFGMSGEDAQDYFRQLISGVEYLHSVGVAHRDLKPENLLLTDNDTLKISDFGLATVFRLKGVERRLCKRCGTMPYVAPEVLSCDSYEASPADIWSCGVILVAMLTGELPWDSPSSTDRKFAVWQQHRAWPLSPWTKMSATVLSLLRCVLHCQPEMRATIDRIKAHQWFNMDFNKSNGIRFNESAKRQCLHVDGANNACVSQPESAWTSPCKAIANTSSTKASSPTASGFLKSTTKDIRVPLAPADVNVFSFSQPAVMENLLISTQSQPSQQSQQNMLQKLVRRMTRFVVSKSLADAFSKVELACGGTLQFTVKSTTPGQLTISTIDCRRTPLVFKVTGYGMPGKTLLDFRLSKGDGLEFKRIFVRIRELLVDIIDNKALNSWTINTSAVNA